MAAAFVESVAGVAVAAVAGARTGAALAHKDSAADAVQREADAAAKMQEFPTVEMVLLWMSKAYTADVKK